jgi:hypothetical protein
MKNQHKNMVLLATSGLILLLVSTLYAADGGVKLGTLEIKAIESTRHNLIIKSSVDVNATFTDSGGNKEYYIGEMGIKLGLDASRDTKETLQYLVISAASEYKTGSYALQGKYFGQKAEASLGAGAVVEVFIGGFDKSFTLQPLAVGTTEGYGVELGLGYLYLQRDHSR